LLIYRANDFEKTAKVADVITAVLNHFGLAAVDYELRNAVTREILQPDRPLVSYHLEDGVVLMLIPQQGGGV